MLLQRLARRAGVRQRRRAAAAAAAGCLGGRSSSLRWRRQRRSLWQRWVHFSFFAGATGGGRGCPWRCAPFHFTALYPSICDTLVYAPAAAGAAHRGVPHHHLNPTLIIPWFYLHACNTYIWSGQQPTFLKALAQHQIGGPPARITQSPGRRRSTACLAARADLARVSVETDTHIASPGKHHMQDRVG